MNLEEFVAESLTQIVNGIVKAQAGVSDTPALINPHMRSTSGEHTIGEAEGRGGQPVSYVAFDVAVTTTKATGTKSGIGILVGSIGLGSQGKTDKSKGSESRIQFKIPVLLPSHRKPA